MAQRSTRSGSKPASANHSPNDAVITQSYRIYDENHDIKIHIWPTLTISFRTIVHSPYVLIHKCISKWSGNHLTVQLLFEETAYHYGTTGNTKLVLGAFVLCIWVSRYVNPLLGPWVSHAPPIGTVLCYKTYKQIFPAQYGVVPSSPNRERQQDVSYLRNPEGQNKHVHVVPVCESRRLLRGTRGEGRTSACRLVWLNPDVVFGPSVRGWSSGP